MAPNRVVPARASLTPTQLVEATVKANGGCVARSEVLRLIAPRLGVTPARDAVRLAVAARYVEHDEDRDELALFGRGIMRDRVAEERAELVLAEIRANPRVAGDADAIGRLPRLAGWDPQVLAAALDRLSSSGRLRRHLSIPEDDGRAENAAAGEERDAGARVRE